MNHQSRRSVIVALLLAAAVPARGQAFDDDDDEPPQPIPAPAGFVLSDANFGQWAFGVQDLSTVRTRMESYLTLKIQQVDRACALSESQKERLALAGRGDIRRIWGRVDEKRRKYVNVAHDQNKLNEIVQDVQSLRASLTGDPFVEGSLFSKVLASTLAGDQLARYEKTQRENNAFRYRAKVDLVIATLDQLAGFTDKQRQELRELILAETRPPRKFGQYDYQVMMAQVSRIDEAKLRPLFDDLQWRVLRQRLEQGRGLEPFLIKNGLLPAAGEVERLPGPLPAPAVREERKGK